MAVFGAGKKIQSKVTSWEGVTPGSYRFGGTEFKLGNHEIGHVHGDALVDVPLPKPVRDKLVASAQAQPHHVLPQSGWVSVYLSDPGDVERAIWILRRSYDLAREQRERRAARLPRPNNELFSHVRALPAIPRRIKEFAYFGFAITLISASIAHFSVGDGLRPPFYSLSIIDPLVFLGILAVSYFYFNKIETHTNYAARWHAGE